MADTAADSSAASSSTSSSTAPAAAAEATSSSNNTNTTVAPVAKAKKLEIKAGAEPSCATAVLYDEDHTIGNALRYVLMKNPAVAFAGYSIPHPSKPVLQLRIQTGRSNYLVAPSSDDAMDEETTTSPSAGASVQVESNGVTAADALAQGVLDLTAMLRHIRETFDAELANATMPR